MKKCFFAFVLLLFVAPLQAANITFKVKLPSLVDVHPDIKSVAIIDRTHARNKKADQVESILTGEGWDGDKAVVQQTMSGLAEAMNRGGRFRVIHTTEALRGTPFAGQFPEALNWRAVRALCEKYNVDALMVLESFDTDFILTNGKLAGEGLRFFAKGIVKVDIGFRCYDPVQQSIVDQHFYSYSDEFKSESGSIQEAIAGLMNRKTMLGNVCYSAGADYANRFNSRWYSITRTYFQKSKKDKDLAKGARMMEANDWDAALTALKRAVEKGHRKTKGKAAHNIAVVYEILGDLKNAKKWATAAWGDYENSASKNYAYKLTRRMNRGI